MLLGTEIGLGPGCIVLDGDPAPPPKKKIRDTAAPQFSARVCCGQAAGWIKMLLGMEVDLGPGHIVLDGNPAPSKRGISIMAKRSSISPTAEHLYFIHVNID